MQRETTISVSTVDAVSDDVQPSVQKQTPRWLHWWALLTMTATFGLLVLGAEVTTKGVGMVDSDAYSHVREPWLFLRQLTQGTLFESGAGWAIEHGHRFAGVVVGLLTIVLAGGCVIAARGPLQWLGPVALLAVISQGLLGIFRVQLHAIVGPKLALVHGISAQLVFGLLTALAVFTHDAWTRLQFGGDEESRRTRRIAMAALAVVFLQLALGALVRHNAWWLAGRLHVWTAFGVVGVLVWLILNLQSRGGPWVVGSACLGILLVVQILLGLESWLCRFEAYDILGTSQANPLVPSFSLLRSLHYVAGTLLFAVTLVTTLCLHRKVENA